MDINNWRNRSWTPSLEAAGVAHRRIYDLRHTYAFFWAIFIYRKQLTSRLVSATGGKAQMPRTTVVQKGAHAATRPVTALVGVSRSAWQQPADQRQESALAGGEPATGATSTNAAASSANGNGKAPGRIGAIANVVRRNGSTAGASERSPAGSNGHAAPAAASGSAPVRPSADGRRPEPTPRAMHEDVMRRARELREHEQSIGLGSGERSG